MKNYYANLLKIYNESELYGHLWALNCAVELDYFKNEFKGNNEPLNEKEFEKLCAIVYDFVMGNEYETPNAIIRKLANGIKENEFTLKEIFEDSEKVENYLEEQSEEWL